MYDELIGNLRAQATHFRFNDETSLLLCQAADAIEELSRENESLGNSLISAVETLKKKRKPKWIPVTERLPKEDETVLTWGKENQRILLDWMHDNKWCCVGNVTHWMPLPEPPRESES